MTPGQYLAKRREAAGLGVIQAAATLAGFSMAPRFTNPRAVIAQRLNRAEADEQPLTGAELDLLRHVFAFDPENYAQLLVLHADPDNPDLPHPAVCRDCACSWYDACRDGFGGAQVAGGDSANQGACHWAEQPSREGDGLCSACLRKTRRPEPVEGAVTVSPVLVCQQAVTPELVTSGDGR